VLHARPSGSQHQQRCELCNKLRPTRFGQLLPHSLADRRVGPPEFELFDIHGRHQHLRVTERRHSICRLILSRARLTPEVVDKFDQITQRRDRLLQRRCRQLSVRRNAICVCPISRNAQTRTVRVRHDEPRVALLQDGQPLTDERVMRPNEGHLVGRAPNNMPSLCGSTPGYTSGT
jgi:hypothetical protein